MAYIMIVDDDQDFAAAAARVLNFAGHEVNISLDTQSPLDSLLQRKADLVILDVMFPEDAEAGFKLARTMADNPALAGIPILMVSGAHSRLPFGFGGDDDHGLSAVVAALDKPIDLDVLAETVECLLASTR